ncbi:SUF system NifU family Fe-S cluster assembly protein [Gleimia sp. 6138-11-ORH1]|uniref:Fe-S cluster assembly sulfur transfer protein SufU n=1 Tax=Gleimia sp. 6138-11-ORH1 TaxID=2973937 RepID=UPI0021687C52|nr:SUF system NifU family Fe-S cluster assembly protein [Gleimia sp. 6138-11-ORH1]MCS4484555.1 SUF system NifU family Fe-S cluster assembly protein [Gleimia sp. 6138-11-ORH1]
MSNLEVMYQQVILDHSRARNGSGTLPADIQTTSYQVNPTCGDEVTLGLNLAADGEIELLVWDGDGCSISQASLSIMSELLEGKTLAEIAQLYEDFETMMHSRGQGVAEELLDRIEDGAALEGTAKFPNRIKCALLGWYALKDALAKAGVALEEKKA